MLAPYRRAVAGVVCSLAFALAAVPVARAQEVQRSAVGASTAPTTVILVRHAEKAAVPGGDPPLSLAGEARSLALLDALREAGVAGIVVTQLQRTRMTAAPLAHELGLEPDVVEVSADVAGHVHQVAAHVMARYAGRTVLVVGHSNTIPAIAAALAGGTAAAMREDEYDDLLVVVKPATGSPQRIRVRYGAVSGG